MTEANLQTLWPSSLPNKCTVFIVQQGLCTIPGKKLKQLHVYTYTYLAMLTQPSSVPEFNKVCTQFKQKPAVQLPR